MTSPRDGVSDVLARAVHAKLMPGASWVVRVAGVDASFGAVGRAAIEPVESEAHATTVYDLASLTKPLVTALALVLLERAGVVSFDEAAESRLVEWRGTALGRRTLLDLASHRSGLEAWAPLYLEATSPTGVLEAIARRPLGPAEERYSDLGYVALGVVVERAAGDSLDRVFESRIARPLARTTLGFGPVLGSATNVAPTERGNVYERNRVGSAGAGFPWRETVVAGEVHDVNAWSLGGVAGHAGLFGHASDVAEVAAEILQPTRLDLDARGRSRLLEVVPGAKTRTVGFVTAEGSRAASGVLPDACPGHVGFTGTSVWLDPPLDAVYVLLTNRVHPEVKDVDFQPVRAAFHREARAVAAAHGRGRPS